MFSKNARLATTTTTSTTTITESINQSINQSIVLLFFNIIYTFLTVSLADSLAAAVTALTSAKHVPRVGDPLLVRACTKAWPRPCSDKRRQIYLSREKQRRRTMLEDVLGQQQAGTAAAL